MSAIAPLILSDELRRRIEAEGMAAFPNECCGMLIGREEREGTVVRRRIVEHLEPGRNAFEAGEQYHRFSIDPLQQLRAEREAERRGQVLLGFYHSHPDHPSRPSEYDREHAWETFSYVIVSIYSGKPKDLTSWMLDPQTRAFTSQDVVSAGESAEAAGEGTKT